MTHITGHDRSQTLLLPEALDDYVGPENPVRFIEAFVEGLDLAVAGFARVQSKPTRSTNRCIGLSVDRLRTHAHCRH